ncbi:extracellular matrix structural constituent [Fragilaria crotonensis]|nr:extracellular matrix structural constituent [Fragilaria crotonensis]
MKLSLRVILLCAFAPSFVLSRLSLVQTYFVPLPEADLLNSFQLINNNATLGARSPVTTIISITIAADGTKIVYDQWEDGYESDPANPTQSTTQIWGDGNLANGAAPGVTSNAGDVLHGGQAIILQNNVPIPRDSQVLFFDGKDRVSATLPIAITRSAYPGNAGSLMAGAVEVFNVEVWGMNYVAPVGQNTVSITSAFEMSSFHVMASKSGTTVTYPSTPGGASITTTIDVGDNLIFQVNEGDVVTSDYPVQVGLITGDVDSTYEMRWYAMIPREKWSSEYISPVAETFGNTAFWFRNPNDQAITIQFFGGNIDNNGQTFSIPPHSTVSKSSDTDGAIDISGTGFNNNWQTSAYRADYTGLKFTCVEGKPFYALVQVDADEKYLWVGNGFYEYGYVNGQGWDWGFPLIPSYDLSSQALVGLGYSCKNPKDCDRHRSYVWVTPVSNAYIFVDFDGDKNFDRSFTLGMLKALLIQDDADFDMSGAMIAAFSARNGGADNDPYNVGVAAGNPVDIAVAWGQNPSSTQIIASSQSREMDLGTVVVPLPNPWVNKQVLKVLNPDGTEDPRFVVDQAGDVIVYEISVSNVGFGNF